MKFQQAAPGLRIARFRCEIERALLEVTLSGRYILGPAVDAFEGAFSKYIGASHAVAVNSGTDALELALRAVGVAAGDEVITTSMSASATGVAIKSIGADIRYADIDAATHCIDPQSIAEAMTSRTVAIVPVHLYGQPCDMEAIMQLARSHGVKVVEDCAQAHGARIAGRMVGTYGDAAAFSFYPTKNLGGIGDGGAVVTGDPIIADDVRASRQYGWRGDRRSSDGIGVNSRMDDVQAAVLSVLLPHLENGNSERRAIAAIYGDTFAAAAQSGRLGLPPSHEGAVYHQFAITVGDRDGLVSRLARRGIGTAIHYAVPMHCQSALAGAGIAPLPRTDEFAATTLSLPVQPEVAGDAARVIADIVLQELAA